MTLTQFRQVIDKASDFLWTDTGVKMALCRSLRLAHKAVASEELLNDFKKAMGPRIDTPNSWFWFGNKKLHRGVTCRFKTQSNRFMLLCCFEEWAIANKRYKEY